MFVGRKSYPVGRVGFHTLMVALGYEILPYQQVENPTPHIGYKFLPYRVGHMRHL